MIYSYCRIGGYMGSEVKNFIYLTFILFIGIFMIASVKTVEADDSDLKKINEYTKYYFILEAKEYDYVFGNPDVEYKAFTRYSFPVLMEEDKADLTTEIVCVRRDENDTTSCANFDESDIVDLDWFYNAYFMTINQGEDVTFVDVSDESHTVKQYSIPGGCGPINNQEHCIYLDRLSAGAFGRVGFDEAFIDLSDQSKMQAMIDASILPYYFEDTYVSNDDDGYSILIINYFTKPTLYGNDSVVPIDVVWEDSSETVPFVLSPILYRVTYNTTTEVETPVDPSSTYDATIDYFYEGTTERVEFDVNPWKKTGLEDQYKETVTSPTKKHCTPDKEEVEVVIDGEDFHETVYYTCEDVENPETGTAFIIAVGVIGVAAIAGAILYYNKNVKKKESNQ